MQCIKAKLSGKKYLDPGALSLQEWGNWGSSFAGRFFPVPSPQPCRGSP